MTADDQNLNPEAVKSKLKNITDYVRNCSARIVKGEHLELQGLDQNVAEACQAAETLGVAHAGEIAPDMEQLIGALDELAIAIKDQHGLDQSQAHTP